LGLAAENISTMQWQPKQLKRGSHAISNTKSLTAVLPQASLQKSRDSQKNSLDL